MIRNITILALLYIILGPAIFWIEAQFMDPSLRGITALAIVIMAVCFFAYSLMEMFLLKRFRETQPESVITLGMTFKGFRLLFTIAAVLVKAFSGGDDTKFFCINLFLFYLATMLFMTIINVKYEK